MNSIYVTNLLSYIIDPTQCGREVITRTTRKHSTFILIRQYIVAVTLAKLELKPVLLPEGDELVIG